MDKVTFGVVKGEEEETFVAVEWMEGIISRTAYMSENELRDRLNGAPQPDIEATIAGARQHPV